jgi:hypothetical protein
MDSLNDMKIRAKHDLISKFILAGKSADDAIQESQKCIDFIFECSEDTVGNRMPVAAKPEAQG